MKSARRQLLGLAAAGALAPSHRPPDVILVAGTAVVRAARNANTTTPLVLQRVDRVIE